MKKIVKDLKWGSRWGFVLAAMSSAIGLANIWRFPFLVGQYGGGAFFIVYLLCLALAGLPLFVLETLIGRESARSPAQAMYELSRKKIWKLAGLFLVFTAFVVSSYYAVIAGWLMGYWASTMDGRLSFLQSAQLAHEHFQNSISSFSFTYIWPQSFLLLSGIVVASGIRAGIERASKTLMPIFFILLTSLVIWATYGQEMKPVIEVMFYPDWSKMTPDAFLAALGHSFFTLSLGQGTLIVYGSYLKRSESLIPLVVPVVLADTLVSVLATLLVFSVCFQTGVHLDVGPGLVFETMPVLFNRFALGSVIALVFFSVLFLATLTSEMSAIEPVVSWLSPKLGRKKALVYTLIAMLIFMLPAALSYRGASLGWWQGPDMLWYYDSLCTRFLIPFSGLLTIIFSLKSWGVPIVLRALERTDFKGGIGSSLMRLYFRFCLTWAAPVLIVVVFLNSLLRS
jgi:NSS family neurotransmitter:Na+ symporter